MLPMKLGLWQVWEQSERVGRDLVNRREEEVKGMLMGEGPAGPANPPDLLVISPDGGRIQDRRREAGERWCEYKAAVLYRAAREGDERTGLRSDPQPAPHWRYTPSCGRVASGEKTYTDPEPEMKTFTATTNNIERFPDQVELEARRRGIMEADTVAVVGDGGDLVWRTAKEVCEARRARGRRVFEILDVIHASGHLVDAAKAAFGPTPERAKWLNARAAELWSGDAEELVAEIEAKATERGPRPERRKPGSSQSGADACSCDSRQEAGRKLPGECGGNGDEADPVKVLWNARDYFDEHRERIRYDVFRRHGLPLSSSHIESGIKQTNRRVKGSEKAWYLEHAEEMLALRCLALSADGLWDDYFDRLRRGWIDLQTPGRLRARAAEGLPEETQQNEAA
jgi:hypothetical protein